VLCCQVERRYKCVYLTFIVHRLSSKEIHVLRPSVYWVFVLLRLDIHCRDASLNGIHCAHCTSRYKSPSLIVGVSLGSQMGLFSPGPAFSIPGVLMTFNTVLLGDPALSSCRSLNPFSSSEAASFPLLFARSADRLLSRFDSVGG